jgi:hypothetical protein
LFPLCVAQFFPFSLLSSSEQGSEAACSVTGLLLGLQFSLPKDALVFRFVSCPVKNLLASAVSCYAKFFFFCSARVDRFFVLVLESHSSGPAFIAWPVDFVGATEGFSSPVAFLRSRVLTLFWLLVSPTASCCLFILLVILPSAFWGCCVRH